MRRFFVSPDFFEIDSVIDIEGDEFHHLKNVCRLEVGERVELLTGMGNIALSEILSISKKSASLKILKIEKIPPPLFPHLEIILSVPRFQKMDLIIQKCAELNAAVLTPVVSERSFVKDLSRDMDSKMARWQKINLEACKQSGRAWPMQLKPFSNLKLELESASGAEALFLFEGEGQLHIKERLTQFQRTPEKLKIFIGSEGGFSQKEVTSFLDRGLSPVTLGPLVLRVETACIAVLSVIQYHFNLMK